MLSDTASTVHDEQAPERVRQLLALNQAAIAITGELELDSLLQRIVDSARELVGCDYSALGVLGDDGYIERFPTSGISEADREMIGAPPRGHGLLGVMLRAGRSLRISNINTDPRRIGFPPHHPPMTSLLGVPIFVRGKLVGDLYLTDKQGRPEFSEEDVWIVQLLATHAATALTNSQLHHENLRALAVASKERARSLALLRVSQAVGRSVQLSEIVPVILDSAVSLLGAQGAALYLRDRVIEVGSALAVDDEISTVRYWINSGRADLRGTPINLEAMYEGQALASSRAVHVESSNHQGDKRPVDRYVEVSFGSRNMVPLVIGQRSLGLLTIDSSPDEPFSAEAEDLASAYGSQASAALSNALLYESAELGRKTAELEKERLRELEQMKDEFLSTAAHELRTPLTSILMSAGLAYEQLQGLADDSVINPRLVDLVGLVLEGSERMQSLVNDLLDLTRLEQGRAALQMEDVDLRDIVRASLEATQLLFTSKHQNIVLHLPETYCGVKGDAPRLEQVVINLLSNAHKYSPEKSRIEVRTARHGNETSVSVRDNGPGVPPEEAELIFQRFYRSKVHRQDRTASTGLGLPIARTIAELHKGRLWVEPAPGGGSVFTMILPFSAPALTLSSPKGDN